MASRFARIDLAVGRAMHGVAATSAANATATLARRAPLRSAPRGGREVVRGGRFARFAGADRRLLASDVARSVRGLGGGNGRGVDDTADGAAAPRSATGALTMTPTPTPTPPINVASTVTHAATPSAASASAVTPTPASMPAPTATPSPTPSPTPTPTSMPSTTPTSTSTATPAPALAMVEAERASQDHATKGDAVGAASHGRWWTWIGRAWKWITGLVTLAVSGFLGLPALFEIFEQAESDRWLQDPYIPKRAPPAIRVAREHDAMLKEFAATGEVEASRQVLLVLGPKGSGKTTLIEEHLAGRIGVLYVALPANQNLVQYLEKKYGNVALETLCDRWSRALNRTRSKKAGVRERPLLYVKLQGVNDGTTDAEAGGAWRQTLSQAKEIGCDLGCFDIVLEASDPTPYVAAKIAEDGGRRYLMEIGTMTETEVNEYARKLAASDAVRSAFVEFARNTTSLPKWLGQLSRLIAGHVTQNDADEVILKTIENYKSQRIDDARNDAEKLLVQTDKEIASELSKVSAALLQEYKDVDAPSWSLVHKKVGGIEFKKIRAKLVGELQENPNLMWYNVENGQVHFVSAAARRAAADLIAKQAADAAQRAADEAKAKRSWFGNWFSK